MMGLFPKVGEMTAVLDSRFAELKKELADIEQVLRDILGELRVQRGG